MESNMVILAAGMIIAFILGLFADKLRIARVKQDKPTALENALNDELKQRIAERDKQYSNMMGYTEDIATKGGTKDGGK